MNTPTIHRRGSALLTPETLSRKNISVFLQGEYDWHTQTRRYRDTAGNLYSGTMGGLDTGTQTHSGNVVFSDDQDRD